MAVLYDSRFVAKVPAHPHPIVHVPQPKVPSSSRRGQPGHAHHDPHDIAHAQHMAEALGWTPDNSAEAEENKREADEEREGTTEGQEDPELAAAVEECIAKMFGVKGILRIGPGRNQADEPVVVIIVAQGFGEASMRVVPEKAGKFPTLLALPFDVLPLK